MLKYVFYIHILQKGILSDKNLDLGVKELKCLSLEYKLPNKEFIFNNSNHLDGNDEFKNKNISVKADRTKLFGENDENPTGNSISINFNVEMLEDSDKKVKDNDNKLKTNENTVSDEYNPEDSKIPDKKAIMNKKNEFKKNDGYSTDYDDHNSNDDCMNEKDRLTEESQKFFANEKLKNSSSEIVNDNVKDSNNKVVKKIKQKNQQKIDEANIENPCITEKNQSKSNDEKDSDQIDLDSSLVKELSDNVKDAIYENLDEKKNQKMDVISESDLVNDIESSNSDDKEHLQNFDHKNESAKDQNEILYLENREENSNYEVSNEEKMKLAELVNKISGSLNTDDFKPLSNNDFKNQKIAKKSNIGIADNIDSSTEKSSPDSDINIILDEIKDVKNYDDHRNIKETLQIKSNNTVDTFNNTEKKKVLSSKTDDSTENKFQKNNISIKNENRIDDNTENKFQKNNISTNNVSIIDDNIENKFQKNNISTNNESIIDDNTKSYHHHKKVYLQTNTSYIPEKEEAKIVLYKNKTQEINLSETKYLTSLKMKIKCFNTSLSLNLFDNDYNIPLPLKQNKCTFSIKSTPHKDINGYINLCDNQISGNFSLNNYLYTLSTDKNIYMISREPEVIRDNVKDVGDDLSGVNIIKIFIINDYLRFKHYGEEVNKVTWKVFDMMKKVLDDVDWNGYKAKFYLSGMLNVMEEGLDLKVPLKRQNVDRSLKIKDLKHRKSYEESKRDLDYKDSEDSFEMDKSNSLDNKVNNLSDKKENPDTDIDLKNKDNNLSIQDSANSDPKSTLKTETLKDVANKSETMQKDNSIKPTKKNFRSTKHRNDQSVDKKSQNISIQNPKESKLMKHKNKSISDHEQPKKLSQNNKIVSCKKKKITSENLLANNEKENDLFTNNKKYQNKLMNKKIKQQSKPEEPELLDTGKYDTNINDINKKSLSTQKISEKNSIAESEEPFDSDYREKLIINSEDQSSIKEILDSKNNTEEPKNKETEHDNDVETMESHSEENEIISSDYSDILGDDLIHQIEDLGKDHKNISFLIQDDDDDDDLSEKEYHRSNQLNIFSENMTLLKKISKKTNPALYSSNIIVLLSSQNNIDEKESVVDGIEGLTYIGGACTELDTYSIIHLREDDSAFYHSKVLAHEILHSLGAHHDEDAGCNTGYIMEKESCLVCREADVKISRCTIDSVSQMFKESNKECFGLSDSLYPCSNGLLIFKNGNKEDYHNSCSDATSFMLSGNYKSMNDVDDRDIDQIVKNNLKSSNLVVNSLKRKTNSINKNYSDQLIENPRLSNSSNTMNRFLDLESISDENYIFDRPEIEISSSNSESTNDWEIRNKKNRTRISRNHLINEESNKILSNEKNKNFMETIDNPQTSDNLESENHLTSETETKDRDSLLSKIFPFLSNKKTKKIKLDYDENFNGKFKRKINKKSSNRNTCRAENLFSSLDDFLDTKNYISLKENHLACQFGFIKNGVCQSRELYCKRAGLKFSDTCPESKLCKLVCLKEDNTCTLMGAFETILDKLSTHPIILPDELPCEKNGIAGKCKDGECLVYNRFKYIWPIGFLVLLGMFTFIIFTVIRQ